MARRGERCACCWLPLWPLVFALSLVRLSPRALARCAPRLALCARSQAFGATIFLSILFSFIYALGLFVPLLLEFGPLPDPMEGALLYVGHSDGDFCANGGGDDDDGGEGGFGKRSLSPEAHAAADEDGWSGGGACAGGRGSADGAAMGEWVLHESNGGSDAHGGSLERKPMIDPVLHVDSASLPPDPDPLPAPVSSPPPSADAQPPPVLGQTSGRVRAAVLAAEAASPSGSPILSSPGTGTSTRRVSGASLPVANDMH